MIHFFRQMDFLILKVYQDIYHQHIHGLKNNFSIILKEVEEKMISLLKSIKDLAGHIMPKGYGLIWVHNHVQC